MHNRGSVSIGSWVVVVLAICVLAWIIAESNPVFNDFLSLIVRFLHKALYMIEGNDE